MRRSEKGNGRPEILAVALGPVRRDPTAASNCAPELVHYGAIRPGPAPSSAAATMVPARSGSGRENGSVVAGIILRCECNSAGAWIDRGPWRQNPVLRTRSGDRSRRRDRAGRREWSRQVDPAPAVGVHGESGSRPPHHQPSGRDGRLPPPGSGATRRRDRCRAPGSANRRGRCRCGSGCSDHRPHRGRGGIG